MNPAEDYKAGDSVFVAIVFGGGLKREIPGEVLKKAAHAFHVKLENGTKLWLGRGRLCRARSTNTEPETQIKEMYMSKSDSNSKSLTAPIGQIAGRGLPTSPAPAAVTLRSPDLGTVPAHLVPVAPPASAIEQLERQGMDPFKIWLDMGKSLVVRQHAAVDAALKELETKKGNYRAAQQILADAEKEVQAAQDAADAAKEKLEQLKKQTGAL